MKNSGFTLMNLLIIIIVIVLIVSGITLIIKLTGTDKKYKDISNNAEDTSKLRKAETIISTVQLAYTNATLESTSYYPTIDKIKDKFNVQGATWTDKGIETNLGFTCEVKTDSNILHVNCLGVETTKEMLIRY